MHWLRKLRGTQYIEDPVDHRPIVSIPTTLMESSNWTFYGFHTNVGSWMADIGSGIILKEGESILISMTSNDCLMIECVKGK